MVSFSKDEACIGLIGMGDMGRLYSTKFSEAGWKVVACDRESNYESLAEEYKDSLVTIERSGHYVARKADFVIYSVETEMIDKVVEKYGPSHKLGSVVGGQTSCKAPEISAFEKHLPADIDIISVHSLHGPNVGTIGQPLIIIPHRVSRPKSLEFVVDVVSCLKSKIVRLSAEEHDKFTADTQAVTHAAFLTMGSAWQANNQYPWRVSRLSGGIENAKINISLRIYSNKWHVYAGLAISNPAAHKQILQYASSVTEIYKLMIENKPDQLKDRIFKAREYVFGKDFSKHQSLLLSDDILDEFSLGRVPAEDRAPNSHLSLLAIVDSWHQLQIDPYDHMICSTPLFRIWLGVTEYLFRSETMLLECIRVGVADYQFRRDDLEFTIAARAWSEIVSFGSYRLYKEKFEKTQNYFAQQLPEAVKVGNDMIKRILKHTA